MGEDALDRGAADAARRPLDHSVRVVGHELPLPFGRPSPEKDLPDDERVHQAVTIDGVRPPQCFTVEVASMPAVM